MNKLTESGSLEDRIGLFWLHRLGIGCLVLGFAFLLMYSFESFGPYLKLLTGFVASVSMIALGEKMATNDSRRWYGHGLIAGGWSIGYFTAYAAYFIDSVQVVSSLTLEMTILLAVAALSLVSALRANSEVMSILSVSLAGVAILLTNPGPMGDVAFVIIAISAAILGNFKTWKSLLLSGLAVCYLGHFISSGQAHLEGVSIVSGDGLESVFLSLIWLTYCVGIGYARQDNETDRKFITLVTCLNAALYGIGLALINGRAIPETVQLLLAASGAVYLSLGRWLYKRDRQEISDVNLIIGLSMINGAKALHFSGTSLVTLDVMQIAVLGYIGARYDNRCFRWFAAGLSLVLFPLWIIGASESTSAIVLGIQSIDYVVIGAIAAGLLAALSYEFGREPAKLEWSKFDRQIYQYFYYLSASVMALLLCLRIVDPSWQVTMITVLAGGLQCLSLKIKDSIHFCTAAIIFSIAAALTVLAMPGWQFLPIALVVAILYIVYAFARTIQSSDALSVSHLYSLAGHLLITLLLLNNMPDAYISVSLAGEGILLLAAGFLGKARTFRIAGLSVFGLLALKLLLFDMANHDTIERIISFIATGFVFLLSSYGYAFFTRAFDKNTDRKIEKNLSTSPGSAV